MPVPSWLPVPFGHHTLLNWSCLARYVPGLTAAHEYRLRKRCRIVSALAVALGPCLALAIRTDWERVTPAIPPRPEWGAVLALRERHYGIVQGGAIGFCKLVPRGMAETLVPNVV